MFIIILEDEKKKLKIENVDFARFSWVIAHGFWAKIASLYFHPIFFPLIHDDI